MKISNKNTCRLRRDQRSFFKTDESATNPQAPQPCFPTAMASLRATRMTCFDWAARSDCWCWCWCCTCSCSCCSCCCCCRTWIQYCYLFQFKSLVNANDGHHIESKDVGCGMLEILLPTPRNRSTEDFSHAASFGIIHLMFPEHPWTVSAKLNTRIHCIFPFCECWTESLVAGHPDLGWSNASTATARWGVDSKWVASVTIF